jgi:2-oxoglutarate ferredoxin oxidoreductase subunit alpha
VEPFYSRLFNKISRHFTLLESVKSFALEDAEQLIIAYGCTARSAQAAVRIGRERGLKIGLLQLISLWPFPRRPVEEALAGKKLCLVPELNMGQISREVKRVNNGRTQVTRHSKMDGSMITPDELLERLRDLSKG